MSHSINLLITQFDFFKKKAPAQVAAPVRPTVVPTPSYNIPAVLLGETVHQSLCYRMYIGSRHEYGLETPACGI